jgi:hypothetical protein
VLAGPEAGVAELYWLGVAVSVVDGVVLGATGRVWSVDEVGTRCCCCCCCW